MDFVKLEPVIKKSIPKPEKIGSKVETVSRESQEESTPIPLKIPVFSVSMANATDLSIRSKPYEREQKPVVSPERRELSRPEVIRSLPKAATLNDRNLAPGFYTEATNISRNISASGFSGIRVGPVGSKDVGKGQSSKYINALSSVNPRNSGADFADILPVLAKGIVGRAKQAKADIIFLIDTTGSMQDNVQGVRNYVSYFLKPIEEEGIDADLGLVLFSDQEVKKAKVIGITDNADKFRKWLDKVYFYGGRDLPESGYEAIIAALEDIKFRKDAQKFFIFISDSPQHDYDYDGKSKYSLDQMVSILNENGVSVDVVGLDYLPIKQLAWGTDGQWRNIPGADIRLDMPEHSRSRMLSKPATPSRSDILEDNVRISFNGKIPDWVVLSCKVLDPRGIRIIGTPTYQKDIKDRTRDSVEFPVIIDFSSFQNNPGIYTLIYRAKDSLGNQDILRQTLQVTSEY